MKVLVTGAGGYLGSVLCQYLLSRDFIVTALDEKLSGLGHCCWSERFNPVRGSVLNENLMARLVAECDAIVHLAAIVGEKACAADPAKALAVTLYGTRALMRLARGRRVVYVNTNAGYPVGTQLTEETPMVGCTVYARLKIEGEKVVLQNGGVAARLASVYGVAPVMRGTLLNWLVQQAFTIGRVALSQPTHRRTFLHVVDAAESLELLLNNGHQGAAYNVAWPESVTKLELFNMVKIALPEFDWYLDDAVYTDTDERDFDVSCARIAALGYRPIRSIQRGIAELVRYYKVQND